MAAEETIEWMTAMDAALALAPRFGGLSRAKDAISLALREAMLHPIAGCYLGWDGERPIEIEAEATDYVEVDPAHWTKSENFIADRLYWDWDGGWFEVWSGDGEHDHAYGGLLFPREEVEALSPTMPLFANALGPPQHDQAKARRGPKPSIRWIALVEAVLALERDGRLMVGEFDSPRELMEAIQNGIPEHRQLDERTIEAVVAHIYDHLLAGSRAKLT
jgi:hypothetical protein